MRWLKEARPKQIEPFGVEWDTWLLMAGRGFGKTLTGAQFVRERATSAPNQRIAVIAPTHGDLRRVCFEGPSGLLAVIPDECMLGGSRAKAYNRSLSELTLWNGSMFLGFSAEEPDRLRGPQFHWAWGDEVATWRYEDAFDQLEYALRLGPNPQKVFTTTPRPIPRLRQMLKELGQGLVMTHGPSYENTALAPKVLEKLRRRYEGTRLGMQELDARLLDDTPGALWSRADIEATRLRRGDPIPDMIRTVVAVDPMVGAPDLDALPGTSSETGIVVCGLGTDRRGYVLSDLSLAARPHDWATVAADAYKEFKADAIVAEANQGGQMVASTIQTVAPYANVQLVHASRGKITRAEPIAALYQQRRISHVGAFGPLEDQLTTYVPGASAKSPDRLDSLVWGMTELMIDDAQSGGFVAPRVTTGPSNWGIVR